jgi:stage III sporulation protein AG
LKKLAPRVAGVVVVARGLSDERKKAEVIAAVRALLEAPLHRIQAFNKS